MKSFTIDGLTIPVVNVEPCYRLVQIGKGLPVTCACRRCTPRILQAIAECDRFIAKEEPRDASLRPAKVAELLDFYKAHRAKLVAMLGSVN